MVNGTCAFKIYSEMWDDSSYQNFVIPSLLNSQQTLELLYSGKKDGFDPDQFDEKVFGASPTLTFVKSKEYKRVFGAFS